MITQEQIPTVIHQQVYDPSGQKVGEVRHVYIDDVTGSPQWLGVRTGMFGTKETFIPTRGADIVSDHVTVSYEKSRIKDAPNVEADSAGHLSAEEERELYRYYGIGWDESWERANRPGAEGWATGAAYTGRGTETGTETGTTAGTGAGTGTGIGGAYAGRAGERLDRTDRLDAGYPDDEAYTGAAYAGAAFPGAAGAEEAITRSEEQLQVGKERYESGHVRLHKYVTTEEEQVTVPVTHEEIRVVREPIGEGDIAGPGGPEIAEAEYETTLYAERPVVSKRTVPVERVRAAKEEITENRTVTESVRKEHIRVEGDTDESGRTF
ncbi:uncharacterized protein (TIGR02271 family) [Thermocatellispora tengchongensis]|uniref:Uncharacterized protein (TIGR02271 family) n=1 Tax=Thermocatellispora tengchongensis TaxID=1073253 RepID=A0A840PJL7_9ACTN|nr:PRC and DUF2382 domain-containing protein [Thermocatellispora tengchongensis]MBB5139159.1 uncharacterized protein (TIGR02271 family) [Thermocatellispora tengchongensis]